MENANEMIIPLGGHFKLSVDQCSNCLQINVHEMDDMLSVPYSSAIGLVMYTMICTRHDLANSISLLSKYMSNHNCDHWETSKWLLRYIKGTLNEGLVYHSSKESVEQVSFIGSNYVGDKDKRRLTSYVFTVW